VAVLLLLTAQIVAVLATIQFLAPLHLLAVVVAVELRL
jgi:hypothetical protein